MNGLLLATPGKETREDELVLFPHSRAYSLSPLSNQRKKYNCSLTKKKKKKNVREKKNLLSCYVRT